MTILTTEDIVMYKERTSGNEAILLHPPLTSTATLAPTQTRDQPEPAYSTATALAWAAGFCDGEGCISISKQRMRGRKNPTYRLRLDISQNHLHTLQMFQATLARHGAPSRLYAATRYAGHRRQIYTLVYDGRHAARAIALLRPYLVRKAPEADVALEYIAVAETSRSPGPNGFSQETWLAREAYRQTLSGLK